MTKMIKLITAPLFSLIILMGLTGAAEMLKQQFQQK